MTGGSFLYTSGRRSPHHEHTGYGLKEGLEGAPYELVEHLELLCLRLCEDRQAREGLLIASRSGEPSWTGRVSVRLGYEPSGRPNVSLSGQLPPRELLQESASHSVRWRFEGDDGALQELMGEGPPPTRATRVYLLIALTCVVLAVVAWLIWSSYRSRPAGYML